MYRRMHSERILRSIMYSALVLSGIFATLAPASLIVDQTSKEIAIAWSVLMIISSGICLFGSLTDRWIGEYTGLPLLVSVLVFYSVVAILSYNTGGYIVVAYGLAFIAFAFGLIERWNDVRKIRLSATRGKDRRGD
jgi:hypothetical protein